MIYSNDFVSFFEGENFSFKEDTEEMIRKVLENLDYF